MTGPTSSGETAPSIPATHGRLELVRAVAYGEVENVLGYPFLGEETVWRRANELVSAGWLHRDSNGNLAPSDEGLQVLADEAERARRRRFGWPS